MPSSIKKIIHFPFLDFIFTENDCIDDFPHPHSPLKFKIEEKKAFYTCSWVKQKSNFCCGFKGVTSTCPVI